MTQKQTQPQRPLRRATYVLTLWMESDPEDAGTWRGVLETGDGHRRYFHTMGGLARLLAQMSGWEDPDVL